VSSGSPDPLGHLGDHSEPALQAALRAAAPRLADLPIAREDAPDLESPNWASGRATVGDRAFAKFAFSERTAVRIWREAQALALLGNELGLPVPKLIAAGRNPALSVTALVTGGFPLDYETVAAAGAGRIAAFAEQLAAFLAGLHAPRTLALARERIDSLPRVPERGLHCSTDDLRTRLVSMLAGRRQARVRRWCDWVDDELAAPSDLVFVHGDFHPYNQLWDVDEQRLLAVVDFETSGLGEPEFDFRVLPVFGPGVDLLLSTVERYETSTGRKLGLPRIMALHLLNYLGDALWRTEAGIALPGPGDTPSAYVDEAESRLAALEIDP
jgi:aminoglycoside phosphotransferase (APT) family kinase protein